MSTPSTSTFSFTFPATPASLSPTKMRRVSLAQESSPRLVQAWNFRDDTSLEARASEMASGSGLSPEKKGKMRRIATDDGELGIEKKVRKKWSKEETDMLVKGCNKWGVGNWKAILNDETLTFDNRSPVDLKDRFRTYFPDAYREHYPNAKTHLSSKVRASNPDGTSIFAKTRSKKRRPFTAEEDAALKAGYDKHGTVWAQIVKDPVFAEQNRRSTDLRDRFRNAFPELYQAAGYKPRAAAPKRSRTMNSFDESGVASPAMSLTRAATDDQIPSSSRKTGPIRRLRRHTNPNFYRGGTKSVPDTPMGSEDEGDGAESEGEFMSKAARDGVMDSIGFRRLSPRPVIFTSPTNSPSKSSLDVTAFAQTPGSPSVCASAPSTQSELRSSSGQLMSGTLLDDEMDLETTEMQLIDQDLSGLSDLFNPPDPSFNSLNSHLTMSSSNLTDSSQSQHWSSASCETPIHSSSHWSTLNSSPIQSPSEYLHGMHNTNLFQRGGNMNMIGNSAWGTQDWLSGNPRLEQSGATSSSSSSFISGPSPTPSSPFSFSHLSHTILDRYDLQPYNDPRDIVSDSQSAFSDPEMIPTNTLHNFHSNYAGDLMIFNTRTHAAQQSAHQQQQQQQHAVYGPGFGFGVQQGLGLSGLPQSTGIHPSQLHTPNLSDIGESDLAAMRLNDQVDDLMEQTLNFDHDDPDAGQKPSTTGMTSMDDFLTTSLAASFELEPHITPPATPSIASTSLSRGMRSREAGMMSAHTRSMSVPPSENRAVTPSRPPQAHANSTPVHSSMRLPFLADGNMQLSPSHPLQQSPLPMQQQQPHSHSQPLTSSFSGSTYTLIPPEGTGGNIPFLDLHYYNSNASSFNVDMVAQEDGRRGQALDLARTSSLSAKAPPSLMSLVLGTTNTASGSTAGAVLPPPGQTPPTTARAQSYHTRVQSAVSPNDLVLRQGHQCPDNNKRKRSSWDGGVA